MAVVRELLALGGRPDLRNRQGATPLSFAALRGHTKVMRLLLDARADAALELHSGEWSAVARCVLARGGSSLCPSSRW